MVCGKLQRMRHDLKKKRKYRIGTATSYDIYENFDKDLGDVKCDAARAALIAANRRKTATPVTTTATGVVLNGGKKKKVVTKKKKSSA